MCSLRLSDKLHGKVEFFQLSIASNGIADTPFLLQKTTSCNGRDVSCNRCWWKVACNSKVNCMICNGPYDPYIPSLLYWIQTHSTFFFQSQGTAPIPSAHAVACVSLFSPAPATACTNAWQSLFSVLTPCTLDRNNNYLLLKCFGCQLLFSA